MRVIGLLPAAGLATRMGGLPKFLLPVVDGKSLIEWHVDNMLTSCDFVVVATRPENAFLFKSLIGKYSDKLAVLAVATETMSDTVLKMCQYFPADTYCFSMPDTYMTIGNPFPAMLEKLETLESNLVLGAWEVSDAQKGSVGQVRINNGGLVTGSEDKNANCTFSHLWGAMVFKPDHLVNVEPSTPHIGYSINPAISNFVVYAVEFNGRYIDCGTPGQYASLLRDLLV